MQDETTSYKGSGVDYGAMDPFKVLAQKAARETDENLLRFGYSVPEWTRGESVLLLDLPDRFLAHVEEGLGTKNLVADAMYNKYQEAQAIAADMKQLTGVSYYNNLGQCTVAMIVNDMITLGALPLTLAMHLAVGDSSWFQDETRSQDLIEGWKKACMLSRCVWGGGETPTLKDVVFPRAVVLSGSAMGEVYPKSRLIKGNIRPGDKIILIESSGIHANGLTLARKIADKLPEGYLTKLSDGRTYGETLLDPTMIYVPVIEDCLRRGAEIHYAVNITGHGWRKLMRAPGNFSYIIDFLPHPQPVFSFIQKHGPVSLEEMYGNYNMGAGFALFVPESSVQNVWDVLMGYEYPQRFGAVIAGHVEESSTKKVVINPVGLEFTAETLQVR